MSSILKQNPDSMIKANENN
jgi:hypothetical protein